MREMKDSKIDWVGEIPKDWEITKVKQIFTHHKNVVGNKEKEYQRLALTLNGVVKRSKEDATGLQTESFETYQILNENDLVFKLIDLENVSTSRVGLSPFTGIVSPAYICLTGNEYSPFAYYWFYSMWQREIFNQMGNIGVRSALNVGDLKNISIVLPSLEEQNLIVKYLDCEIPKISLMIKETEDTIKKYKEYKQSIIIEVATMGLNKNVKMKDSNIEWIDKIPMHWDTYRGKNKFTLIQRPILSNDDVITCFRDGEVTLRTNRRTEGFTFSEKEIGYQGIDKGDLVVHGMDGFAGSIGISDSRGKASPVLINLEYTGNKRFLMYLLRSMAYNGIFTKLATGIRVRTCDLNWKKLSNLSYFEPPIEEQNQIVEYLDKKCSEIDTLIEEKQSLIKKLEDYKKSLIYECVTGKREIKE